MDAQVELDRPANPCGFLHRVLHRFIHGQAPVHGDAGVPFSFDFDVHPGPVDDAITDAQNLHRSLLIFIYCVDNPATRSAVELLQRRRVADEIREHFIVLALDAMWPEGWRLVTKLDFEAIPVIALVRPRGTTLAESQVYCKYEGAVSEDTLLSAMRIEMTAREPDTEVVREQNDEFDRVVREAEEITRREEEAQEEARRAVADEEKSRDEVERAYEQLMQLGESGDVATIRFQFPDSQTRTHKFARDGPVRNLFVFARKFMFPQTFELMAGFPQRRIEENEERLDAQCKEKQFIVYVEDVEC